MERARKTPVTILGKISAFLVALFIAFGPFAVMATTSVYIDTAFAMGNEAHSNLDDNGYEKNEDKNKNVIERRREASNYYIFDVEGIFSADGTSSNRLWDGMVNILQIVTSAILLPIGIVFVTWRCAYIATVVYIGHVDPLHMVFQQGTMQVKPRYQGDQSSTAWTRRSGAFDWGSLDNFTQAPGAQDYNRARRIDEDYRKYKHSNDWAATWNTATKRALLIEVKNMGLGLFIVFAIWSLLNLLVWLVTILLNWAGTTGGDVMVDDSVLQAFQMLF